MPDEKMVKIKPTTDIVYGGMNHKKDSEPFEVPEEIAKRLIDGKNATEVKK